MDTVTKNNQEKWDNLVKLGVPCSRPYEGEITHEMAKSKLDPNNLFGELKGKNVLCLACGGGQQSILFVVLGAIVSVVDFSQEQLKKDIEEAKDRSLKVRTVQTDMRDLSIFKDEEFDVVYQPYSINYVPDAKVVFDEVSRILRPGGIYYLMFHNPFVHGSWKDGCWGNQWENNELSGGKGYFINLPYRDGEPIKTDDPNWNFENKEGKVVKTPAPQEFKLTLSTVMNTLIEKGFSILRFEEHTGGDFGAKPGTWDHYTAVAPPWLHLWVRKDV